MCTVTLCLPVLPVLSPLQTLNKACEPSRELVLQSCADVKPMRLAEVLQELRGYPVEELIQPELKQHRQAQDLKIREDQDLANGAVLQAEVEAGHGDKKPLAGDLVFVHVSICTADEPDDILYTTRADQGGSGQPLAFILEKGARAPRSWEITLLGMRKGGRMAIKARPSYGYHHPTCKLQAPPGIATNTVLGFDLQLVDWMPSTQVRACGPDETMYKQVLREGTGWESVRPPFEVSFHVIMRTLAYDAVPRSGRVVFDSHQPVSQQQDHQGTGPVTPIKAVLGSGQLPAGIEEALSHMSKDEQAVFIMPAAALQQPMETASVSIIPQLPAKSTQMEVELELLSLIQVRDMTGTGEVIKRRLKEGQGEFPIDCPLNDTTIRVHYRVRGLKAGSPGPWLLDTRHLTASNQQDGASIAGQDTAGVQGSLAAPVEIDTGCGEAPEALEMCAKLMLPGEVSSVVAYNRKYGYEGRGDAPAGLQGDDVDAVEWEVELISFDKEGHWQVMEMQERFELAERVKAKANGLVKAGKYEYARARYDRLLRLLESTRDYETEDEVQRMDSLKLAVLLNLALCCISLNEPAQAITWCDKAIQYDEQNAKAFFRRGRALSIKGDYEEAEEDLKHALQLDSSLATEVEKEMAANRRRAKEAATKQKKEFKNFFK